MFTRKPDKGTATDHGRAGGLNVGPAQLPAKSAQARSGAATGASVIGADLCITGNLESTGEVRIEGEVQGDIHARRIVVGAQGSIAGELVADEIIIGGIVQGSVRGNNVTFQSASHIEGEVFHRSLSIEQGAYFEGKSRRSENPMQYGTSGPAQPS